MSLEQLENITFTFAIGTGTPSELRAKLREGLQYLESTDGLTLAIGDLSAADDSALNDGEPHTLVAFADDAAGQVTLSIYADAELPTPAIEALERGNGLTAADPADLADSQVLPFVRSLCLLGVDPDLDTWRPGHDKAELAALSKVPCKDGLVLNDDGSLWKHGRQPKPDAFTHSFVRVVALRLAT